METALSLWANQIGDTGAQAIAEALKVNKTLASIRLEDNFLTEAGITALRETGNTSCELK
ncbi:hypothetical protein CAOG_009577 [Capsaspora owczarzaki ATCC 30864]|uniref:Uncharacterized protein n=1 Tax=Capsaspora owczarzaki (strain ATCC 30864) TaxID=595528 RepID=A0A0D2VN34_CAPO3|nr:hypothetical protein CAOG_009577 [Capsaspora owczarzaki ATCC 30864]